MSHPEALQRSRHLVRIQRTDGDAALFHSLYGTSLVLNAEAEAVLDLFRSPTTVANARARAQGDPRSLIHTLLTRRFLIDPSLDERAAFSSRMRPEPPETGAHLRSLVLLVAEQCNLACPYCIKDRLMGLRSERRQTRMPLSTARTAIDAFLVVTRRAGQRDVELQFRGGEPLMSAAVVLDAIAYMRARWTRGVVHASMVSNATLVTDALARALAELRVRVEVSIDGPREVHDTVRITRGGGPTHGRVVAGIRRLLAAGVDVPNVNATVTAETLTSLDESFFAELARLGVRSLNLEPDVMRPAHPDPKTVASRLLALREAARSHGVAVGGCWGRALQAIACVRHGASLPPAADYPLLVVDARGQVVRWEYNGVAELGPVSDLTGVLASEAFSHHVELRTPGRIPECVGCEVEGLCQGNASMTLIYERATGRRGLFAHRCELIRTMTREVLASEEALGFASGATHDVGSASVLRSPNGG